MTVRIADGARKRALRRTGWTEVHVQAAGATDAVVAVLEQVAAELTARFVSPVYPKPDGAFFAMDEQGVRRDVLAALPDLVASRLQAAGVGDAVVDIPAPPADASLANVREDGPAVFLWLFPPPPPVAFPQVAESSVPDAWVDTALEWLTRAMPAGQPIRGDSGNREFTVDPHRLPDVVAAHRRSAVRVVLAAGDDGAVRAVTLDFAGFEPSVRLALAGSRLDDEALAGAVEELAAVARRQAASVAYAYVSVDQWMQGLWHLGTDWCLVGGPQAEHLTLLCDEVVFDAFPYQVLGPGHLGRLGGIPPGGAALAAGRAEVVIGTTDDWLFVDRAQWDPMELGRGYSPPRRNPTIREDARRLLEPCMVLDATGEAWALRTARAQRG
ncbi:MAG TPA: hypothetical protein VFJ85_18685 [Acidimicrobiales bacterium]|nr:hypothetical protein [Acidimicrobiales bacterium]